MKIVTMMAIGLALLAEALGAAAGDAVRGETLYEARCSGCHALDAHRVGPLHRDVFGRKAGSAAGYDFSPALRKAKFSWDELTLDRWLAGPEAFVPGQKMGYSVPDPADRADLIAYLRRAGTAH